MRYRILGALEVSDDAGTPLRLGGRKQRALLAMLLVHRNEPVSADRLTQALWGDEAPADAVATLRIHVSRLRRVLTEPEVLITTSTGYQLHVRPGELDAERFEALVAEKRLREALEEWRGPALVDVALERFAQDEAARLEELRLAALEARIDADLTAGSHAELVGELKSLVSEHPLRERFHAQLMLALYRSGRQAEALEAFQRARSALVDELGIEPGNELRRLHQEILTQTAKPAAVKVPLPSAVAREAGHGPFVGREPALQRLNDRWARARAGERQFVLLVGEPGIGKTRLASEFAAAVHTTGATVLYGRSDPEAVVPYQPFVAALGHYLATAEASLPPELDPELSDLARLLPALRRRATPQPVGDDTLTRRFLLHDAVASVLAFAAPLVLVLDDLHWADTGTVLMLRHLLDEPQPAPLLVLGTAREAGERWADALAELVERRRRGEDFERVALAGLDPAATAALAAGEAPSWLHERTDGNPLFIHELLRSLGDGDESTLPEGVKETIERRLARLSPTAKEALSLAAVQGREFRVDVLDQLLDAPGEPLLTALDEAVASGLVRELDGDRLVFAHALVQETLYERQTLTRRMRTHRRIGAVLESRGVKPAEVAHHFTLAQRPERTRYLILAGREATAALAYEEAAGHYRKALEAPADELQRFEILLALGDAERAGGDPSARATYITAADVARQAGLREQFAAAALAFPVPFSEGAPLDHEAAALLEEALAMVRNGDDPLVVKLLARLANVLTSHASHERLDALSREALEMGRRLEDADALLVALDSRMTARYHIAHLEERLVLGDEMLALGHARGAGEIEAIAQFRRAQNLVESGDLAAAREAGRDLARLADALRQPLFMHSALCWEVVWAEADDRIEEAWELADRAFAMGEPLGVLAYIAHASHTLVLLHREGRLAEHVPAARAALEVNPTLTIFRAALCLGLAQSGELEAARAELDLLAADDFAQIPPYMLWFSVFATLAEACALLGDRDHAAAVYARLLPYRERIVQVAMIICWGSVEYHLGLLAETMGETAAALEHYELATARNEAAGLHYRALQANAGAVSVRKRLSAAASSGGANRYP